MNELKIRALGANPGNVRAPLYIRDSALPAGTPFILIRQELGAEDAAILGRCAAVILTRSGLTGDGAIMARALGKPCVVSAAAIRLQSTSIGVVLDDAPVGEPSMTTFAEGIMGSIDGKTGDIVLERP